LLSWNSVNVGVRGSDDRARTAAAVVELIHLATLVHDDVLDESNIRRGKKTMNCLRGNESAVILGDYLLSSAFHLCSTIGIPALNILLGEVTNTICAGELVQLYHRNNVDLGIDAYYQIIHDKTASLIAASCVMGGMLGGANDHVVATLEQFGDAVGTAFQIRDDLLDLLGEQKNIGKPTGKDLDKGKLTLPVISMLNNNAGLKGAVREAVVHQDGHKLQELLDSTDAIQSAVGKVAQLVDDAVDVMNSNITSPASTQLCALALQLKHPVWL